MAVRARARVCAGPLPLHGGLARLALALVAAAVVGGARAASDAPWDPNDVSLTRSSTDGVEWVSSEPAAWPDSGVDAWPDDELARPAGGAARRLAAADSTPIAPSSAAVAVPANGTGAGAANRTSVVAPLAPNAGRRNAFLNYFHSRCITFIGDSVSREMHFHLLLFAFGCASHNTGQQLREGELIKRFRPRGVNVTDRCAFFRAHMKDRSNRVTRIPVDRDPAHDIIVRFIWARYLEEVDRRGQLSGMLDMDACDVYVLNAGFWHLRLPRNPAQDVVNASGQMRKLFEGLRWHSSRGRRDLIRRRLVWRSSTLIELELDLFNNPQLHRLNQRLDGTARSFGLPVYNYEALFAGAIPTARFKFTMASLIFGVTRSPPRPL